MLMNTTFLGVQKLRYVFPPNLLEDFKLLRHHFVTACSEAGITTTAELLSEFRKPTSPFLNSFESLDIERVSNAFLAYDIIATERPGIGLFLAQQYPCSLN